MSFPKYQALSIFALIVLGACSNGRGSVSEGVAEGEPPPSVPDPPPQTPPPSEPPPALPPEEPPPEEPPPSAEPPQPGAALAGYWRGRIVDEDSGRERQGVAFVDHSGDMQIMAVGEAPEFVLHGEVCCGSNAETDLGAHRYLSTREDEADLEARLSNGRLRGGFEFRDRRYEFDFQPHSAYSQPLTLAALAGVYTRSTVEGVGGAETMTLTIDSSGAMTGAHSNGCIFNGTASIPDPARNMLRLNIELSGCGGPTSSRRWNGSYRGLGVLLRDAPSPSNGGTRTDVFYHSIVGPTWFGLLAAER